LCKMNIGGQNFSVCTHANKKYVGFSFETETFAVCAFINVIIQFYSVECVNCNCRSLLIIISLFWNIDHKRELQCEETFQVRGKFHVC
jgi:hypothetical protein